MRLKAEQLQTGGSRGLRRLGRGLIRGYQLVISPLTRPSCRFYPVCSTYVREAIAHFGMLRGCWLGVVRLLRCHPFCDHGVDFIPAKFEWFPARNATDHHGDRPPPPKRVE